MSAKIIYLNRSSRRLKETAEQNAFDWSLAGAAVCMAALLLGLWFSRPTAGSAPQTGAQFLDN